MSDASMNFASTRSPPSARRGRCRPGGRSRSSAPWRESIISCSGRPRSRRTSITWMISHGAPGGTADRPLISGHSLLTFVPCKFDRLPFHGNRAPRAPHRLTSAPSPRWMRAQTGDFHDLFQHLRAVRRADRRCRAAMAAAVGHRARAGLGPGAGDSRSEAAGGAADLEDADGAGAGARARSRRSPPGSRSMRSRPGSTIRAGSRCCRMATC